MRQLIPLASDRACLARLKLGSKSSRKRHGVATAGSNEVKHESPGIRQCGIDVYQTADSVRHLGDDAGCKDPAVAVPDQYCIPQSLSVMRRFGNVPRQMTAVHVLAFGCKDAVALCHESRNNAIPYSAAQLAARGINFPSGKSIPGFCRHGATMDKNIGALRLSLHEDKSCMKDNEFFLN